MSPSAQTADLPVLAAPLRLPAIFQNPISVSQRQVEAHNAQQREKIAARREAKARAGAGSTGGGKGIGKRVIRRTDNASFIDNPHIVQPRRTDLFPSVPLHPRPSRPSFPPSALDRSTPIPSVPTPDRDPFSDSSLNGAFTTSLKGTRALLRKRGHRAEGLVDRLESTIRAWLGGDWSERQGWSVIDDVPVDVEFGDEVEDHHHAGISTSTSPLTSQLLPPPSSRRLPPQHRIQGILPSLPLGNANDGRGDTKQVPAVLELSRSVAHLTLAAADPFDRLVIHLIARYYECLSWSEEHISSPTRPVRLTHLIVPSIARPRASAVHPLLTPETTDVSDQSGLSASDLSGSEGSGRDSADSTESEGETETERGTEVDPDETYRADEITNHLESLHLQSTTSSHHHGLQRVLSASSSTYASSEAESDMSSVDVGTMGDSMNMFPPVPALRAGRPLWVEGDEDSASEVAYGRGVLLPRGEKQGAGLGRRDQGWADKPTFFEYLYGA